jgi:hypothetical protein
MASAAFVERPLLRRDIRGMGRGDKTGRHSRLTPAAQYRQVSKMGVSKQDELSLQRHPASGYCANMNPRGRPEGKSFFEKRFPLFQIIF